MVDPVVKIKMRRGLAHKIAKSLGLNRATISRWHQVPAHHVLEVEKITGIRREVLRPDVFRDAKKREKVD